MTCTPRTGLSSLPDSEGLQLLAMQQDCFNPEREGRPYHHVNQADRHPSPETSLLLDNTVTPEQRRKTPRSLTEGVQVHESTCCTP